MKEDQPQLEYRGSIVGVGPHAGALSVRAGDPLFPRRRDMSQFCTDRIAEQQTLTFSLDSDNDVQLCCSRMGTAETPFGNLEIGGAPEGLPFGTPTRRDDGNTRSNYSLGSYAFITSHLEGLTAPRTSMIVLCGSSWPLTLLHNQRYRAD
jgi:hypothetical protein